MRLIKSGAPIVASALLLLAGCGNGLGGGGADNNDDSGPILLGMTAPFSGPSAVGGPPMRDGAQLAVDEINAAGGVLGRQLKLEVQDDACDPKTGVAAANKLVSDGITVSVGGYCSGVTLPMLPIFDRADIPMIIPAANSNELVKSGQQNAFLINGTGTQQADAALKWLTAEGAQNVAIINDNTAYSKDIADLTEEIVNKSGSMVVSVNESITPGESDYSANINAVLDKAPDYVYFTGYYQEGGLVIRQLRQAGYDGKIMVGDANVTPELISIAGANNAEGVYATMTQTPDTIPGGSDWIAAFKEKFNKEPGPYSNQSYDAVRLAAEAIKVAGSTDGKEIIAALEGFDLDFDLFSGPLKFADDHTLSEGGFQILEVSGAKWVLKDDLAG